MKRLAIVLLVAVSGCHAAVGEGAAPIVQPGAPGSPSKVITADQVNALAPPRFTAADVQFMQGMIGHHAQALEMTRCSPRAAPTAT